ncbi:hypothetical protein ES705_29614 [subsurface metagenome]
MKVICGWCNKVLNETDNDKDVVSHGICKECANRLRKESGLDKKKK